jgi:electron transport complex protein RnfB
MSAEKSPMTRRQMLCTATRCAALGGIGGLSAWLLLKQSGQAAAACPSPNPSCDECSQAAGCRLPQVWQLDPNRCVACGRCQTSCVLDLSAVKAVNCFALCGYCDTCTGYFPKKDDVRETGAEHQLCPTGAITRTFIDKQGDARYFEYTIDERLCIACGKCVVGCRLMNGSLYLQVRHDRCLNCNECSIAVACPTQAFRRVPAAAPRLLSQKAQEAEEGMARKDRTHHAPRDASHHAERDEYVDQSHHAERDEYGERKEETA